MSASGWRYRPMTTDVSSCMFCGLFIYAEMLAMVRYWCGYALVKPRFDMENAKLFFVKCFWLCESKDTQNSKSVIWDSSSYILGCNWSATTFGRITWMPRKSFFPLLPFMRSCVNACLYGLDSTLIWQPCGLFSYPGIRFVLRRTPSVGCCRPWRVRG